MNRNISAIPLHLHPKTLYALLDLLYLEVEGTINIILLRFWDFDHPTWGGKYLSGTCFGYSMVFSIISLG